MAAAAALTPARTRIRAPDADTTEAALVVGTASGDTGEDGTTATFTVALTRAPTATVTIAIATSDDTEGAASPAALTFTAADWDQAQTVTVTGVDDDVADGAQAYDVTLAVTSDDAAYAALPAQTVALTNADDDVVAVAVTANTGMTTEGGGQATFAVALGSRPSAEVTLTLASADPGEGTVDVTTVVFAADAWDQAQTVTVTGVNDDVADGTQDYAVTIAVASDDAAYAGLAPPAVPLVNADDDAVGVAVGAASGSTTEAGGTATFDVVLESEPVADVTVTVASDDVGEGVAAPATLTFTAADWATPQTVTVTGEDDAVDDGDVAFGVDVTVASADPQYDGLAVGAVAVTNVDDDTAGITVGAISGHTGEDGTTATFTLVLDSEPTHDVTLSFDTDDATEGTVDVTSVTFTPADWDDPRTVTVTGVDDDVADGDVAFSIVFAAAVSDDPLYAGVTPAPLAVTNDDDGEACPEWPGDDFEDGDTVGWTFGTGYTASVVAGAAADGSALGLELTGSSTHYQGAVTTFAACQPTYVSAWIQADASTGARAYLVLGDDQTNLDNGILFLYASSSGSWRVFASSGSDFLPVVAGAWVHFELEIDWTARTIDVYADGVLRVDNWPFRSGTATSLTQAHLYNFTAATTRYDEIFTRCD